MPPIKTEIACRAAHPVAPDCLLDRALLFQVLGAVSQPPASAPVDERHAHLRRVITELCALAPGNPIEAMLAAQIVAGRHAAEDAARRSADGTLDPARMRRRAEAMLRMADRAERTLRRAQARRVPGRQVPAEEQFDLAALDADWFGSERRKLDRGPSAEALELDTDGAVAAPLAVAPGALRTRYTLSGQRADLVDLATVPVAGSA
jgi:hypothetical protein